MVEENNQQAEGSYYRTQFEKLQRLKLDLEDNFQLEEYKEDRDHFYARNHKVRRRHYVERGLHVRQLLERRRALYDRYMTLRGLYLRSRSDMYDDELQANFGDVRQVNEQLEALKREHEERPDEVFDRLDENADDEERVAGPPPVAPVAPASSEKRASSKRKTPKATRVKNFLFKTYAKCAEAKRSDPEYMSKEAIIAHIKEHYPEMLRQLPKNLRKMKREEICKVIFK